MLKQQSINTERSIFSLITLELKEESLRLLSKRSEDFDKVINVNVRGLFLRLKHVLPVMIKQSSGSIINTFSVAGLSGSPQIFTPLYCIQACGCGLDQAAAVEAAGANVRVNSILSVTCEHENDAFFGRRTRGRTATLAQSIPLNGTGTESIC